MDTPGGEKRCCGCCQTLPFTMFDADRSRKDGRKNRCRPCSVEDRARWLAEDRRAEALEQTWSWLAWNSLGDYKAQEPAERAA